VLATDGWLPFKQQFFAHDPQLLQHVTDMNQQANAGMMSSEDFVREVANLAHVEEAKVHSVLRTNVPNEPLLAYIRQLKPRYKIGFLSNSSSDWVASIFTKQQTALFDDITLSFEVGLVKPSPQIYELAARRLEVEPEQCVFVDDQERYTAAAEDVGMQGICYQDFEQCKADLERILAK